MSIENMAKEIARIEMEMENLFKSKNDKRVNKLKDSGARREFSTGAESRVFDDMEGVWVHGNGINYLLL